MSAPTITNRTIRTIAQANRYYLTPNRQAHAKQIAKVVAGITSAHEAINALHRAAIKLCPSFWDVAHDSVGCWGAADLAAMGPRKLQVVAYADECYRLNSFADDAAANAMWLAGTDVLVDPADLPICWESDLDDNDEPFVAAEIIEAVAEGTYDANTDALVITEAQAPEATQAQLAAAMSDTDLTEVHEDLCQLISRSLTKAQADLVRSTRTVVENEIQRRTEVREAAGYVEALTAHGLANAERKGLWAQTQDRLAAERLQGIVRNHQGRAYHSPLLQAEAEAEAREQAQVEAQEVGVFTYAKTFRDHVIECDGPEFYRIEDEVYEIMVNDPKGNEATMSDDDLRDKACRIAQRIDAGGAAG